MTKRFGFTLAEVLITLGIIGVVAAMTIPTLISNTNGAQFKSAYKKALSSLNQAVLMNVAMEDTDFSTLKDGSQLETNGSHKGGTLGAMLTNRLQSATDVSDTYFTEVTANSGALPTSTIEVTVSCTQDDIDDADAAGDTAERTSLGLCEGQTITPPETTVEVTGDINFAPTATDYFVYALADGTYFGFKKAAVNCSTKANEDCMGFIDVNGSTNPNTIIECDDEAAATCEVSNSNIKDIYPVYFYGQTVEPASEAARTVLFGK